MHNIRVIGVVLIFAALAAAAAAQTESLLIGPGDLIQIDVLDTPEMEQQVRVNDEGAVPVAFVGAVKVSGLSPSGAADAIQKALIDRQIMKHPQVTIRVQEYATQDVSVLGQVHTPGTYAIDTPQTILKVLSLAGGLTDMADRQVSIKRHDSSQVVTYYLSNSSRSALEDAVMVYPGDTVLVPKAPLVYILGDVNRPGGYAISTNDSRLTILQALAMAGSASKTSVKSHVRLIRTTAKGQIEMPIHLDAIEKGKQVDIAMQPNDILFVPFSWMKNMAMAGSSIAASTAGAAVYTLH